MPNTNTAQPFDSSSQAYVQTSANVINAVAAELGVSSTAIAGAIAREITLSYASSPLQSLAKDLGVEEYLAEPTATIQEDF
jgi:hypothetical protein